MRTPFRKRFLKRNTKWFIITTVKTVDQQLYDYHYELNICRRSQASIQKIREFTKMEFEKFYNLKVELVLIHNIIKDIK